MKRIVVDTNLWIRILLGGPVTLPMLEAWQADKFLVIVSQPLLDELEAVSRRPRLRRRIDSAEAEALVEQLRWRAEWVEAVAIPPRCRDPKDHPILATAISGRCGRCRLLRRSGSGSSSGDHEIATGFGSTLVRSGLFATRSRGEPSTASGLLTSRM